MMKNSKVYLNLFLILLFGLLIRITAIDKPEGLWNDEYISWYISSKPLFSEFIQAMYKNCHMPFYYIYLKICNAIFGSEDIVLRISSVFPGIAGILTMFFVGREIKDDKTGLLCASMIAVSGFMIYFSQEVRFYSLLFWFSSLAVLFTLKLIEKQSYLNFVFFYLFNLMIMFTHTIGFVFVFFNCLFTFWHLKRENKISFKQIFIIILATILAMMPFIPFLYKTLTASYISQFWSDFSLTKLFFVFADYVSPIQINLVNTPLHISTLLVKGGKFNWGYFLFAIIPLIIAFIGIIAALIKNNKKIILLGEIALSTLLVMIIASSMGKMVLITKYTIEIYPVFIAFAAYGLYLLKPNALRKFLFFAFFGLIALNLFLSDYAPQKLNRPEGHKLVANLVKNAALNSNDKILLLYYDVDRFGKYMPIEDLKIESITKYNFQYCLLNNPPSHIQVIKDGKEIFLPAFKSGTNDIFNAYLKNSIFDKLKSGDKFALISLNSVAFIDEERMQTVVSDKSFYKRMPFLFMIFSYIVNNTKNQADMFLKPVYAEKQGKWEIFVWEKE